MCGRGSSERVGDGFSGDATVGGQVEQETEVVVEPIDDFGIGSVG